MPRWMWPVAAVVAAHLAGCVPEVDDLSKDLYFAPGTWTSLANMPTARRNLALTAEGATLYALGGTVDFSVQLPTAEAYDTATNTWSTRAPMPTGYWIVQAVSVGGLIYLSGPRDLLIFDPAANAWSTGPQPLAQFDFSAAVGTMNGLVYLVGGAVCASVGCTQHADVAQLQSFDPASGTYTAAASMPTARNEAAVVALNGLLYVLGGYQGTNTTRIGTVEAYDPATDTWTALAPMPHARAAFGAAAIDGLIYAIGGGGTGKEVDVYSPTENRWAASTPLPSATFETAAAAIGSTIFLAGGQPIGPGALNTLRAFNRK